MASQGNRGFSQQEPHRGQEHGGQERSGQERSGQEHSRPQQGATGVMDTVREGAANLASNAGSQVQHAWQTAREGVGDFTSNLPHNANEALSSVSAFISNYPIPSLLCAVGLGFLLGRTFAD